MQIFQSYAQTSLLIGVLIVKLLGGDWIGPIGAWLLMSVAPFLFDNDRFRNLGKDFKTKLSLSVLPLLWMFIALWGQLFRGQHGGPRPGLPGLVTYVPSLVFALFLIYGVILILKNKRHRFLTLALVWLNSTLLMYAILLAGMSMDDTWL